jgi:hypothetical protein
MHFPVEFIAGTVITLIIFVLGLGVTLAMDAKTKGEFWFAATCFLASSVGVMYGIETWQTETPMTWMPRILFSFLAFALLATGTGEAIRWAHNRHLRTSGETPSKSTPSKPQSPEFAPTNLSHEVPSALPENKAGGVPPSSVPPVALQPNVSTMPKVELPKSTEAAKSSEHLDPETLEAIRRIVKEENTKASDLPTLSSSSKELADKVSLLMRAFRSLRGEMDRNKIILSRLPYDGGQRHLEESVLTTELQGAYWDLRGTALNLRVDVLDKFPSEDIPTLPQRPEASAIDGFVNAMQAAEWKLRNQVR